MAVTTMVGVLIRYDEAIRPVVELRAALDEFEGIETFPIEHEGQFGAVIEADSLDLAHAMLRRWIEPTPGVSAAWPVSVQYSGGDADADPEFEPGTIDTTGCGACVAAPSP